LGGQPQDKEKITDFFLWNRKRNSLIKDRIFSTSENHVSGLLMTGCHTVLRRRWCHIFVLNVHASTDDQNDDSRNNSYEELQQVFHPFPKYHMKILLRDLTAQMGTEDTFKPTTGNESLNANSNDSGVKSSKPCHIKKFVFLRAKITHVEPLINKHCISPNEKTHSDMNRVLIKSRWH
jgi:hypothetical protein